MAADARAIFFKGYLLSVSPSYDGSRRPVHGERHEVPCRGPGRASSELLIAVGNGTRS
jgi:hypothetical protein